MEFTDKELMIVLEATKSKMLEVIDGHEHYLEYSFEYVEEVGTLYNRFYDEAVKRGLKEAEG
jgi:hypothetical protein